MRKVEDQVSRLHLYFYLIQTKSKESSLGYHLSPNSNVCILLICIMYVYLYATPALKFTHLETCSNLNWC